MKTNLNYHVKSAQLLLLISAFLFSCSHEQFPGFEKTETGLYYKFHVRGSDTVHAKYGEVVRVKMAKRLNDSTLENTNTMAPDGVQQYLREGIFKGAIEEGIVMMAIGDSATFMIPTDSVNKYFPAKDSSLNFAAHSYLAFDVKLMEIKSMEQVQAEEEESRRQYILDRKGKEGVELSQYLQDNHIEVKPAANGSYYIEKEKGKGACPKDGDSVVVHYTAMFLNGTIFDSSVKRNQPLGFTLGTKRVIQGWEDGIKTMRKGSVGTFIFPSSLGYDSTGFINPKNGKYFIPPYAPLKFEIQLLDILSKK